MDAENDEDSFNNILKILAMRSMFIKNMKWEIGNMDQISFKAIKGFFNP